MFWTLCVVSGQNAHIFRRLAVSLRRKGDRIVVGRLERASLIESCSFRIRES
jgi:hypothetical protein